MRSPILPRCIVTFACGLFLCVVVAQSSARAGFTEQGATVLGGANYSARSASLADIDNDGDLDLLFQGGTGAQQLFRNNFIGTGVLTYTNVTATMFPSSGIGDSWSAAWGDYNGDGRVDVFIGQTNSGTSGDVLRNDGASGLTIQSTATGLNDPGFHQNVGWVDINNDHRLDLLIGMEGPEKNEIYTQDVPTPQVPFHFSKAGAAAGFQQPDYNKAYGMAIGDTDGDGDLDVYISTCRGDNNIRKNFYKNMLKETGTLSFVDISDTNGTQSLKNAYGVEFVDLDNDGDLDLYRTGADGELTKIFRNDGNNQFTDVDTITGHVLLHDANGVSTPGTDLNGSKAIDFDNDGDLDLFFHDNLAGSGNVKLYRNDGNWNFTDVTAQQGLTLDTIAGTPDPGVGGYDSVWGDIDRDGDQDLINPNNLTHGTGNNTPERAYISDASTNGNHWLYVKLLGPSYDTTGIGSSLYATIDNGTLTLRREANTNADTFNQSDLPVHFGLGAATDVEWLRVVWPDGTVQFLHNIAADQYLTVSYAAAMPGDFDGDGAVNSNDYVLWRKYFGAPFTMADYDTWRSHFGQPPGSGSVAATGAVPEPASVWLVLAAAFAGLAGSRRRRSS